MDNQRAAPKGQPVVDELGQAPVSASRLVERCGRERDGAQHYLDIAGVMILELNVDGTVALINRRGCNILGYDDPEQIFGQSWITFASLSACERHCGKRFTA